MQTQCRISIVWDQDEPSVVMFIDISLGPFGCRLFYLQLNQQLLWWTSRQRLNVELFLWGIRQILVFLLICDLICMTPQRNQTKHLPDYPDCSDIKLWDWPLLLWISPVTLASEGYLLVANPAMADFQFWLMPCCLFSSHRSACHLLLKWVWIQILWSKRAVLQLICQTCQ